MEHALNLNICWLQYSKQKLDYESSAQAGFCYFRFTNLQEFRKFNFKITIQDDN
jgi:hypothetical protein